MPPQVASVYPDSTAQINYTTEAMNYQCVSGPQYTVVTGDSVTIQCIALGIPPPSITWYRNGTKISNNTDPRVNLDDPVTSLNGSENTYAVSRTLTLEESNYEDSGTYECKASNDATPGEDSMDFVLIVHGKNSKEK